MGSRSLTRPIGDSDRCRVGTITAVWASSGAASAMSPLQPPGRRYRFELPPARSRSVRTGQTGRRCDSVFVDAAVWLGLVRVLRFLKLGSDAGDEVDASSCGGAVVTALAGSRLPGLRASSLVALEASLPCTKCEHVARGAARGPIALIAEADRTLDRRPGVVPGSSDCRRWPGCRSANAQLRLRRGSGRRSPTLT
jgi:hypothetical protein